jgi:hydrogenase/urease accessory protein HupE
VIPPLPLAHGTIEGIGDLWNGVLHPLRSPIQLMVLCALALVAGQRTKIAPLLIAFLLASVGGIVFSLLGPQLGLPEVPPLIPCVLAGVAGVMVAARTPLKRGALLSLFAAGGFVLGWDSGQDPSAPWVMFKLLLGAWIGLAVALLNFANYAAICPKRPWIKIGFRVLGSWVIASSILFLAFTLRGAPSNKAPQQTAPEQKS